jgi:hypothetical protein
MPHRFLISLADIYPMVSITSTKHDEKASKALNFGEIIPEMRESEFTSPQQDGKATEEQVKDRLMKGITAIEAKHAFKMSTDEKNLTASLLATEIVALGNSNAIEQKTAEVLKAMDDISSVAGDNQALALVNLVKSLSGSNAANFIKHTAEFVQIARFSAGRYCFWSFSAIAQKNNTLNFDRHPAEFVQIAKVGEGKTGNDSPDKALLFFDGEKAAKLLDKFPTECVQLVQAHGGIGIMMDIAENQKSTVLFSEHSASIVKMAQISGKMARKYLSAMQNDSLKAFFAKDADKAIAAFEEISQYFQFNQTVVGVAFYKLSTEEKVTADFFSWQNGGMGKEQFFDALKEAMKKL